MKHILLIIVVILFFTIIVKSQTTPSICDSLNNYWDNFFKQFDGFFVTYMESAPELLTSIDSLCIRIKGQDSLFSSTNQFKAFVTFYVNDDGDPICLKLLKPNNIIVQNIVASRVGGLKFKPAIISGKIRIVPMALQFLFIKDK
jgi:hypothetical protein